MIQVLTYQRGWKDAEHWGVYGPVELGSLDLHPELQQMQPTGRLGSEQGDEGRKRALEAATVARAEGGDWGGIAQSLRESPGAGPRMQPAERALVERARTL